MTALRIASLCYLLITPLLADKGPKIATIQVVDIAANYYKSESDREELSAMDQKIDKNKRTIQLKNLREKIEADTKRLRSIATNPKNPSDEEKALILKIKEAQGRYEDVYESWKHWSSAEKRKLTLAFTNRSRATLNNIIAAAQTIAEAKGFDIVFDPYGWTSSQMPAIIYLKGDTDLSKEVIELLNKDAPVPAPSDESE